MRRAVLLLVLPLLLLLAGPAAAEDDPGFVIDRFTSDVTLRDDGTLEVVEEIAVDFSEERHGIFRVIPLRYPASASDVPDDAPGDRGADDYWRLIEIDDVAVDATAPADVVTEEEDGALVLRIGDEDTEITGPQTYRIAYAVSGAVDRVDELARLSWDVTGSGWEDVPMAAVEATVTTPAPIAEATCAAGPSGSQEPCAAADTAADSATFAAAGLEPGEQLTVRVDVPAEAVTVPPPIVAERWRLSRAMTGDPLAWPLAAVAALVAFGALVFALRRGRDEAAPQGTVGAMRFDPPEDVRPAELSVLLDERVDQRDLSATLVDLAERGFLEIEQRENDDDKDWRLRRLRADDASASPGAGGDQTTLRAYERDLLSALFADGDEVDLGEVEDFHESYGTFRDEVYDEAVRRGWFPVSPATVRTRWAVVAVFALVVAIGVLVAALVLTELAVAAVPLVLAALAFLILHGVMPHRTAEGSRMRAEAESYREGLTASQPGQWESAWSTSGATSDPRALFGRHLGYAVAVGSVPALVRRMQGSGAPIAAWAPYWYIHPMGMGAWRDPDVLSDDIGSFAEQAGTGLSANPATSGGGGVSAGGGFGGGGGGGW